VVNNPAAQQVNAPQEGDTTVSQEGYQPTNGGTADTVVNGVNEPTASNGVPGTQTTTLFEDQVTPTIDNRTIYPANPEAEEPTNQDLLQRLDTTLEAYTAATPATATGTLAKETGSVSNIENSAVPSNPIEIQVNELYQVNERLATSNGVPANPSAANNDVATQVAQYQEQVLLQTIGTQLAQIVPPSNIFSFLG
jgi:hypothetical protein